MRALVFNCGSSSLKFELAELDDSFARRQTVAHGKVEEIGARADYAFIGPDSKKERQSRPIARHDEAAALVLEWLGRNGAGFDRGLDVTAHRIVHGGVEVTEPRVVDDSVLAALERATQFAPLHNPPSLAVMREVRGRMPAVPCVVAPDTAFHRTLEPAAYTYALPHQMTERHQIRRFGFHGLGHAWMMERYAALSGKPADKLNLVTMHLGNGCSATAIRAGRSIDTSMGMTPLEGLVMGTRSGDLDPAIITWLAAREKLGFEQVERMLNHDSGMLGVSAISADLRQIQEAADRGDPRAALALEVFCHRARKYLGAYLALVGQPDAVIFGGGIGEHADRIRAKVCADLEWLGLLIDPIQNRGANGSESRFSTDASRIEAWVIPLDEELYIARAALKLVRAAKDQK